MVVGQLRGVVRHLHQLTGRCESVITDAQLLQRFVTHGDEVAFELLLLRHGPMVRTVCRRLLRHNHDAEDAFQATFLTLVRKAGGIRGSENLSGWLYRVAYRTALRARRAAARLPLLGSAEPELLAPEAESDLIWRDLRPVLDEEVNRLPTRYSLPIILCYFQGFTHEQAAHAIGCPKATVGVRLMRARKLLHARLTQRGLALSATALATCLTEQAVQATLPAGTVQATVQSGGGVCCGIHGRGVDSGRFSGGRSVANHVVVKSQIDRGGGPAGGGDHGNRHRPFAAAGNRNRLTDHS